MTKHDPAGVLVGQDCSEAAELALRAAANDSQRDLSQAIREIFLTRFENKLDTSLFAERVADDWLTVNMRSW